MLESHITFAELLFESISITKEECQQKIKMFKVDWFNHISSLKGLYKGFTEFCDEVDLNKDQLIYWFETEKIYMNIKNHLDNDIINHNAELAERYKTQFKTLWEIQY